MKTLRFVRLMEKKIVQRPLTAVFSLLISIYLCATFLIMICEGVGFGDATLMILPAFVGELGSVECRSIITQVSVLVALVVSVAFLAVATAKITSLFIEFCKRGGSIVKKVSWSDHIMICGWNSQGQKVIDELLHGDAVSNRGIVILANCERRPVKDELIDFVKGDPTQDVDLKRAGVQRAHSVIVLSNLSKADNEADAEALMIVLAVESLNRAVHTTVQLKSSANRAHLERAHADEIICLDQMGGNIAVASTINHGVSTIVNELLTFNSGSEFYRCDAGFFNELVGKEFCDAVQLLAKKRMILMGFDKDILHRVKDETRVIVVNPQSQYIINKKDSLFIIAEKQPMKY
jgi:voltage-gated potassium channel